MRRSARVPFATPGQHGLAEDVVEDLAPALLPSAPSTGRTCAPDRASSTGSRELLVDGCVLSEIADSVCDLSARRRHLGSGRRLPPDPSRPLSASAARCEVRAHDCLRAAESGEGARRLDPPSRSSSRFVPARAGDKGASIRPSSASPAASPRPASHRGRPCPRPSDRARPPSAGGGSTSIACPVALIYSARRASWSRHAQSSIR